MIDILQPVAVTIATSEVIEKILLMAGKNTHI